MPVYTARACLPSWSHLTGSSSLPSPSRGRSPYCLNCRPWETQLSCLGPTATPAGPHNRRESVVLGPRAGGPHTGHFGMKIILS